MPGELSAVRELVAGAVLVLELGAVGWVATVATVRLVGRDPLVRALSWLLLVLAQVIGVPLLLGMVGLLRLAPVVVAHAALAAAASIVHHRSPAATADGAAIEPTPPERGAPSLLEVAAGVATTLYLTLAVRLSVQPQRSLEFDTKEYHLANLASWVQSGNIWKLPFAQPGSVTATHPGNGEMLGAWLALPTHGDELVYLAPVAFGLLAVLAGALLGRELANGRDGAALGALGTVAVLTAPAFFGQVDSMLTDLISAAGVLSAVALVVLARRSAATAPALVGLAGAALGLGIGSKYTALFPGLAVAAAALLLLRRRVHWWWLTPGVVLFAAPWFVRNLVATGNPLFPQQLGPLQGARTPYDVIATTLLHQVLDGKTAIVHSTASLARTFVGPVLLLVAAGLVLPWVRTEAREDRTGRRVVGGLIVLSLVVYLITPYTGGGPTGLAFIIVSCFRYATFAVLLATAASAALAGRRLGGVAIGITLAWNLWHLLQHSPDRPQLDVSGRGLAISVAGAVLVVASWTLARAKAARLRRIPIRAMAAVVVALIGVLAVAGVVRHTDRGRTPTPLEATLLSLGAHRPAIVLGVADLRAVLGPRLQRRLVKVSRGGAAEEIPFADEAQLRRRVLGEHTPPPPPELGRDLDRALARADADLLVVSTISPVGYPDGWRPAADWCFAGSDAQGVVFVRARVVPAGLPCVRSPALSGQEGTPAGRTTLGV